MFQISRVSKFSVFGTNVFTALPEDILPDNLKWVSRYVLYFRFYKKKQWAEGGNTFKYYVEPTPNGVDFYNTSIYTIFEKELNEPYSSSRYNEILQTLKKLDYSNVFFFDDAYEVSRRIFNESISRRFVNKLLESILVSPKQYVLTVVGDNDEKIVIPKSTPEKYEIPGIPTDAPIKGVDVTNHALVILFEGNNQRLALPSVNLSLLNM